MKDRSVLRNFLVISCTAVEKSRATSVIPAKRSPIGQPRCSSSFPTSTPVHDLQDLSKRRNQESGHRSGVLCRCGAKAYLCGRILLKQKNQRAAPSLRLSSQCAHRSSRDIGYRVTSSSIPDPKRPVKNELMLGDGYRSTRSVAFSLQLLVDETATGPYHQLNGSCRRIFPAPACRYP
jgi:hypothetical protein